VSFQYGPETPVVLERVSLNVAGKEFVSIVGPSGGGKSTVLRLAAGLIRPTGGTLVNKARTRMVFQNGALLPWRTVRGNIALGFTGIRVTPREVVTRTDAVLAELGILAFADAYPRDLSGGQRQRVGIARALVSEPELLLLDEPFSALDVETTERLASELLAIREKRGITMLMVSHSIEDAVLLADRVLVCANGSLSHVVEIPLSRPRERISIQVIQLIRKVRSFIPGFDA
jgi:NitT/TauT family transport system ATP-binding protein